jgi:hypothetical protein
VFILNSGLRFEIVIASHVSQDGGRKHVALVHVVYHPSVFGVDFIDHVAD